MQDLLVVEDNLFIQQLIKGVLRSQPYELRMAVDQFEAQSMFETSMPDVLISDLHMPTGTTQEFLKQVYLTGFSKVLVLSSDYELLEQMQRICPNPRWQFVSKNGNSWIGHIRMFLNRNSALEEA
jgi:CheY-like chemotaxis protein